MTDFRKTVETGVDPRLTRKKKKQSKEEGYFKKGSITHCTSYIDLSG